MIPSQGSLSLIIDIDNFKDMCQANRLKDPESSIVMRLVLKQGTGNGGTGNGGTGNGGTGNGEWGISKMGNL